MARMSRTAGPDTAGSWTVTPVALAITASSTSVAYAANVPPKTASFSGFVYGATSASLTTQPTCTTVYTKGASVAGGPYGTSCSGAVDGNYTISYTAGAVRAEERRVGKEAWSTRLADGANEPNSRARYGGFVDGDAGGVGDHGFEH